MTLRQGWLRRQYEIAHAEVQSWPAWMKPESSVLNKAPADSKNEQDEPELAQASMEGPVLKISH